MDKILFNRSSIVAVLLLFATVAAWLIFFFFSGNFYASVIIILIALIKVRAILYTFMELSCQLLIWRVVFNVWLLIVGVALVTGSYSSFYG